jgi:hypothetical protein
MCVTAPQSPRFHRVPRCSRHPRVLKWLFQLSSLSVLSFLLEVHLIFPFAPCVPSICAHFEWLRVGKREGTLLP